ncbi:VUT family protein [Pseudomonas typographi]|uniref:PreQ0 transporter n=1 Tax=Pseudomonas typographi TaxID=2715964 RepID=A0ABR7Z7E9_9PSED|nr:VUT family protein [Pseudomonas typographi]MBD1589011.1 preQ0 transporter [Pseudomonas typographi]MBD1601474.1 preQ0 transporter [Pseudomonas typographi]
MIYLLLYVASVVLINFAFSAAPQLDVLWSAWGGLVFILRDLVQTRFGHRAVLAMLVALLLSYFTSEATIALASALAFGASECIDWLVFSVTRRPLHDRLWLSSALSIPVDTLLFFGLIGALTPAVAGTSLLSKFAGVSVVWLAMAWRIRRRPLSS